MRFINDLDTDEESENENDDNHLSEEGSGWETDLEQLEVSDQDNTEASSEEHHRKTVFPSKEIKRQLLAPPKSLRQDLVILSNWKPPKRYGKNVEADFWTFAEREKSKGKGPGTLSMGLTDTAVAFKKSWHSGDLEPGAPENYREARTMVKHMKRFQDTLITNLSWVQILRFLDIHPHSNRRVIEDICDARAMMALFFDPVFLSSELGAKHTNSLLLKQAERARKPPSGRSHTSNTNKAESFWNESDAFWDNHHEDDPWPMEWDTAIRPFIAKLYKAGIIGNHYDYETTGLAVAASENGRERDLYIDLRTMIEDISFGSHIEHPPSTTHLLSAARTFTKTNPNARFALLLLWSAPHFYPLMVGLENRACSSFTDALGRAWEWNFLPKDMPGSETSMHHSARLRVLPFWHLLGKNVIVKRNLYMVMGKDEEELRKFAIATTFVVQMEPWRLEVDLWKSFVNVDLGFLERLDRAWLD